jgi:hypothetical protein
MGDPTLPNKYKFLGDDSRFTFGFFYTKNEIIKRSGCNEHTIRNRLSNQRDFTEDLFKRKSKAPNGARSESVFETSLEKFSGEWLKRRLI